MLSLEPQERTEAAARTVAAGRHAVHNAAPPTIATLHRHNVHVRALAPQHASHRFEVALLPCRAAQARPIMIAACRPELRTHAPRPAAAAQSQDRILQTLPPPTPEAIAEVQHAHTGEDPRPNISRPFAIPVQATEMQRAVVQVANRLACDAAVALHARLHPTDLGHRAALGTRQCRPAARRHRRMLHRACDPIHVRLRPIRRRAHGQRRRAPPPPPPSATAPTTHADASPAHTARPQPVQAQRNPAPESHPIHKPQHPASPLLPEISSPAAASRAR